MRGFGADVAAPVDTGVTARTPPYNQQALALMGVTLIPWLPVVAGMLLGDRFGDRNGRLIGGSLGFGFSFLVLRQIAKNTAGTIT